MYNRIQKQKFCKSEKIFLNVFLFQTWSVPNEVNVPQTLGTNDLYIEMAISVVIFALICSKRYDYLSGGKLTT